MPLKIVFSACLHRNNHLLNSLTDADVLSYDKLFATLDSTTRRFELENGRAVTITDTVGFIQKLPTTLVNAFQSTLDEICRSDFVLHVVDASSKEFESQIIAVENVLEQIGANDIPRINVFNKCDLLPSEQIEVLKERYPQALFISTLTGFGLEALKEKISEAASATEQLMEIVIPYSQGDLVSLAHEKCRIISESYEEEGTRISLYVGNAILPRFEKYQI